MDDAVIKTAGRVFEVLEHLREHRREVTVRELVERFGWPLSSTLALLKSMAALGYLRHDQRLHAFVPTARLAGVGDWVTDYLYRSGPIARELERVARVTGQTAILGVESDLHAQYVHVILGGGSVLYNVQAGTRRLLCRSGMGWALIADRSPEAVADLVRRTNARLGADERPVDARTVGARLAETRRQGHAFSRGTVTEGVGIIALPLGENDRGERLAIGVGGLVSQLERDASRIVQVLREAAAAQRAGVSAARGARR